MNRYRDSDLHPPPKPVGTAWRSLRHRLAMKGTLQRTDG